MTFIDRAPKTFDCSIVQFSFNLCGCLSKLRKLSDEIHVDQWSLMEIIKIFLR
jgi:hypothetical protein